MNSQSVPEGRFAGMQGSRMHYHSFVVPLDSALLLLKLLLNASLHVALKCRNWAQWEKADEFDTLMLRSLDSHGA